MIGPNYILTSAYNVYDYTSGIAAKEIRFTTNSEHKIKAVFI